MYNYTKFEYIKVRRSHNRRRNQLRAKYLCTNQFLLEINQEMANWSLIEAATTRFITETIEESDNPTANLAGNLPREASSYLVANIHASNTITS